MQKLWLSFNAWLDSREPRERIMLLIAAIVLTLVIFYSLIWQPLSSGWQQAQARLVHGLEVYRALNGHYPPKLEVLTSAQLVGERLVQKADVVTYLALPNQGNYRLRFAEADANNRDHRVLIARRMDGVGVAHVIVPAVHEQSGPQNQNREGENLKRRHVRQVVVEGEVDQNADAHTTAYSCC